MLGQKQESPWHGLQSELAKARAATLTTGTRQNRAHAWFFVQSSVAKHAADAEPQSGEAAQVSSHLRPARRKQEQMIVFLHSLERCQVGIIRSVWRRAVHKAGSKQTRTQRATRPSPCALPLASCVAVRVLQMTEGAPGRFFLCSLLQCFLLDSVGTVLCELTDSDVQDQDDGARTVYLLPDKSLEALRAIKEKPELWKNPSKQVVKQLQDNQAEVKAESRTFVASSFSRSLKGTENLQNFLMLLPAVYKESGREILDDAGNFES